MDPMALLHSWLDELAGIDSEHEGGGVSREVFSPAYMTALDWLTRRMAELGLSTRLDAFGNLIGIWPGTDPELPALMTGSHIDTVLNGGRYDGTLGVVGALVAVALLQAEGVRPRRDVHVIAFAGEEPRFGRGCLGSRALTGTLTRADLDVLVDRDGVSLATAMRAAGLEPDRLTEAHIDPGRYLAHVELHIEQGVVLEHAGVPVGIVDAIAAARVMRIRLRGRAGHAGATPMTLRADALTGAAELILAAEATARSSPGGRTVATVGEITALPGAVNVVPGEVHLSLDVRDPDAGIREAAVQAILAGLETTAARRGLEVEIEVTADDLPARCGPEVVEAARASAEALELDHLTLPSGAFHDALVLSRVIPVGMIFVPSQGGISHHPDEFTAPAELEAGVRVLAGTLSRLAS